MFIAFFIAGTALSKATRFKKLLRPFVKRNVSVEVWGAPVPDSSRPLFEIDSISAFGAGLLIHLRASNGGPRVLLKVAQPVSASVHDDRIEISDAAYVSFAGTRLRRAITAPALSLVFVPDQRTT